MRPHEAQFPGADTTLGEVLREGAEHLARLSPADAQPPWVTLAGLAPELGRQVGLAFGVVLGKPGIDRRTREIITVSALAALGGLEPQLAFHLDAALRAGVTAAELVEALTQISVYAGIPRALNAVSTAGRVFADAGVTTGTMAPRATVAAFVDATSTGDMPTALGLLADGCTWRIPGTGAGLPWAGTWTGAEGALSLRKLLADEAGVESLHLDEPVSAGETVFVRGNCRHSYRNRAHRANFVLEFHVRAGVVHEVRMHGDGLGEPVSDSAAVAP